MKYGMYTVKVNFGWSGDHLDDLYYSEMYDHIRTMDIPNKIKYDKV